MKDAEVKMRKIVVNSREPAIWFPCVQAHSGADIYTQCLVEALVQKGLKAEITWLPHQAEYFPWSVKRPEQPKWANIIHVNSWLHSRFIPNGLPIVTTIHNLVHDREFRKYKNIFQSCYHDYWIKRLEKTTVSIANTVTAVSLDTAKKSEKVFNRKDICPIPNWVDTNFFKPIPRTTPNKPFRLLFVGHVTRRKGSDLLLEIMRNLGNDYELYITCDKNDLGITAKAAKNIVFLGRLNNRSDIRSLYQKSDALLFPTRLEGLSLAALEAQACGLPIITSNNSSMPEIVEHMINGVLCPLNDVNAFVEASQNMAKNKMLWKRMKVQSRILTEKKFSRDIAIDQYVSIYRSLL